MRQRWLQKMRKKLVAKSTKFQNTASTDSHGIEKGGEVLDPHFFSIQKPSEPQINRLSYF